MTLAVATVAFCFFGTVGYVIRDVPTLIACRAIAGAGAAAILTMGVAVMGQQFPHDRRDRLIGINAMCSSLAAIATVSFSGALGAYSPHLPFLLHLLPVPLLVLAFIYVPAGKVAKTAASHVAERLSATHWGTFVLALASGVAIFSIPVYLPFFMRDAGHINPVTNATVLAFMSVCSAGFAATYGWARARLSIGAAFAACLSLFVAGCVVLLYSTQMAAFGAAALLLGCGMAWVAPNLMSAGNLLSSSDNRGRVIGLIKGANLSGSFVAVLLLDPIYRTMGARPTIIVIGVFAALLAILGSLPFRNLGR